MSGFLSKLRHSQDLIFKGLLVAFAIALIVLCFPGETKYKYEYDKGKPWLHEDIIAQFDFAIHKSVAELAQEEAEIKEQTKPYFNKNLKIVDFQLIKFENNFEIVWPIYAESKNDGAISLKSLLGKLKNNVEEPILREAHLKAGKEVIRKVFEHGILKIDDVLENKSSDYSIFITEAHFKEEKEIKDLYTIQQAHDFADLLLSKKANLDKKFLAPLLEEVIVHNISYNQELSDQVLKDQLAAISLTKGRVEKNEKIIDHGTIVTDEYFYKLESLRIASESTSDNASSRNYVLLGQIILITILIMLLIAFLGLYRKDIVMENDKLTFLLVLVILMTAMARLALSVPDLSIYVFPFAILPIITRAFFDARSATFVQIITCILIGFIAPNSFEFVFIQVITGIVAIFSLSGLRRRGQIFNTCIVIFLSYSLCYFGFAIMQEGDLAGIDLKMFGWFAASAILILLAYPLMFAFERVFNFLSDVSLMELSDTNNALLRELSEKAPGTFQHSLQVANLAEEAVHRVGGNALLIRTAALYHDIGKMKNPIYFIENQSGINPHDEMSYKDSAKVIIDHVIHGIELAKKHGLPEQIIDFIRTHHGTSTTGYFYQKYMQDHPDEIVEKTWFQYPGPLPYSKETAILMMADAVEAASRSLKTPDGESITKLVENIIEAQARDGQFTNADITFKDISIIKKMFIHKLQNIYHVRIEYPKAAS